MSASATAVAGWLYAANLSGSCCVSTPIYMDHHSTTPVDPRVLEAMLPFFSETFGNAASRTRHGQAAARAVERARGQVAALIGAPVDHIVFTSGATESNHLAIRGALAIHGAAHAACDRGQHIITQATEHKAVRDVCRQLKQEGFRVTELPVDSKGRVDPIQLEGAIDAETTLVSIMLCNNEIGAVQDIARIGRITRARGITLHCDAAQGAGYVPLDVNACGVDLVSLSAHKMYGPKGIGALYVRRKGAGRVQVAPQLVGGGHEFGLRSGTLNVPGIVGMGAAAELAMQDGTAEAGRLSTLRNALWRRLQSLEAIRLNGPDVAAANVASGNAATQSTTIDRIGTDSKRTDGAGTDAKRHPGNLNVSFACVPSASLLVALADIVSVSSGSACSSATPEPSYVLPAIGAGEWAKSSIRFGLGRGTTETDVETVAEATIDAVTTLRDRSPEWTSRTKEGQA